MTRDPPTVTSVPPRAPGRQPGLRLWLPAWLLAASLPAPAAIITVDSLDDTLDLAQPGCTLREALANANGNAASFPECAAGSGADTITFAATLFTGTPPVARIDLSAQHGTLQTSFSGGDLALQAPPGMQLVIAGAGDHQLLRLAGGSSAFVARDVELRGGRAAAGAAVQVAQPGAVTFERVRFVDNVASGWQGGGALLRSLASAGAALTFRDCSFEDNHATASGGGALAITADGPLPVTIEGGLFEGNGAAASGGAIAFTSGHSEEAGTSLLAIRDTLLVRNSAEYGGGLGVRAAAVDARLSVLLDGAAFVDNSAVHGGGVHLSGTSSEPNAFVLRVARSSFVGNSAGGGMGGAVHASDAAVLVDSSAFSFNTSTQEGAALLVQGDAEPFRMLHLAGNTFYRNAPLDPGASSARTLSLSGGWPDSSNWSWAIAGNVIVRDPATGGDAPECELRPAAPLSPQVDGGSNITDDPTCLFVEGDRLAAPQLQLSAGAGVHPWNLSPVEGSPAIDAWPADGCVGAGDVPLVVDLAGVPRPQDGDGDGIADCDAGAFERLPAQVFANGFE